MLKRIAGLDPDTLGFEASGTVTAEDYKTVLVPAVEEIVESGSRVRFLYVLGPDFEKFELGAMWQDTKVGMSHLTDFARIAVVTSHAWLEKAMHMFTWMIPCPVKIFDVESIEQARSWVQEGRADTLEVRGERLDNYAFLSVKVSGELNKEMESRLVETAEATIGDAEQVRLLIQAHDFHGWSEIKALWMHLKFALGVHRKVDRLAIVGEEAWQKRLSATAGAVLGVDARFFDHDQLETARKWALER
jgi:stage II sporulation SpoAA-like protein